jgi:hypothetical protein
MCEMRGKHRAARALRQGGWLRRIDDGSTRATVGTCARQA